VEQSRAVGRYVAAVRSGPQPTLQALDAESVSTDEPWWATAQRRARRTVAAGETATPPWWRSRQPLAPLVDPVATGAAAAAEPLDGWVPAADAEPESSPESEPEAGSLPDWVPDTNSGSNSKDDDAPDDEAPEGAGTNEWWVPAEGP
jgi:hypothetical protein